MKKLVLLLLILSLCIPMMACDDDSAPTSEEVSQEIEAPSEDEKKTEKPKKKPSSTPTPEPIVYAEGLAYEVVQGTQTCVITGIGTFEGSELNVPPTIDQYTVVAIGTSAFNGVQQLTKLFLPDSVKEIQAYAFYDCNGLTEITEWGGTETIGRYAFQDCSKLNKIHMGDSVKSIGECAFCACVELQELVLSKNLKTIENYAFQGCFSLQKVSLPASVSEMGMYTFSACEALKIVEIEEGVTNIGREAFSGCSGLISITLPKTLTTIGSNAFYAGDALIEIINHSNLSVGQGTSIGSNAKVVHSGKSLIEQDEDGFLFYNEQGIKYLVGYIGLETTLTLPSDFSYQVYSYAFYANRRLLHVSIPDGVSKISKCAFSNCTNLMTVEIPQTVTEIQSSAFRSCSKIECIFYGGTKTQAENISIAQGNEKLDIDWYYYSEQTPIQEGNYWHYVNGVPTEWKAQS